MKKQRLTITDVMALAASEQRHGKPVEENPSDMLGRLIQKIDPFQIKPQGKKPCNPKPEK